MTTPEPTPRPGYLSPVIDLPEPNEGIAGIDRAGDALISLDDDALPVRAALAEVADRAYRACLVGNPAPLVRQMYDRINFPQVGDLVVEDTARVRVRTARGAERIVTGFGYLIERRLEWAHTRAEWQVLGDAVANVRLAEDYWYIQYGPTPQDVCRWSNCHFITVLTNPALSRRAG